MNPAQLALASAVLVCLTFAKQITAQENPIPSEGTANQGERSSFETAESLWSHIESLQKGPSRQPTSQEDALRMMKEFMGDLSSTLEMFLGRFPDDPRRWSARLMLVDLENASAMIGGPKPDVPELRKELTEIANAKDAPRQVQSLARLNLLGLEFQKASESCAKTDIDTVEKEIKRFSEDYPEHEALGAVRLQYAILLQTEDPEGSTRILEELKAHPDPTIANQSSNLLDRLTLKTKPLDLEFTATDGRKVSLADLRGNVVLLDFWATWCGPCVQEAPRLVEMYRKLHDQGFEIVGISLDQDRAAYDEFTEKHGMTWPQYFDGRGWSNNISQRFGIQAIPAMWLLDKQGFLVNTNAHENLETQVSALLKK